MPEQAPRSAQRLDQPGQRGSEGQRGDDESCNQRHRRIGGTHHLGILADQTGNGESEEGSDRAKQANRRSKIESTNAASNGQ